MTRLGRILVPVSRGGASRAGLDEAIRIATRHHAVLRLVHVIDECLSEAGDPDFAGTPSEAIELIALAGARVLHDAQAIARRVRVGCYTVLCDPADGPIAEQVARQARDWGADLVVMGVDASKTDSLGDDMRRRLPPPLMTVRWWPTMVNHG